MLPRLTMLFALVFTVSTYLAHSSQATNLFDTISDSLSDAGDVILEAGDSIAEGAKEVGKDIGIIDEEKKEENTTKQKPAPSKTVSKPAPAETTTAKLPGGVSSRIKNMYKELDKVEIKLKKGAGTGVDRANRAKADLKRAKGYMNEIEKRYKGQYSPDHPDMLAALERLEEVTLAHQVALGEATEKQAELARQSKEKEAAEREKDLQAENEKQKNISAENTAQQNQEETCNRWLKSIEQYTYGDKTVSGYSTDDQQLMATWKGYYDEAETILITFRSEMTAGACSNADSVAELLDSKMTQFSEFYQSAMAKQSQAKLDKGRFVFSSKPITNTATAERITVFNTGDYIYGIVEVVKPWSEIYGKKKNFNVTVNVKVDGKKIHSQFIKLKTEEYAASKKLIFNVAPKLENLVAYTDTNIEFGKSTPVIRQGPNELTHHLSKLSPGKHTFEFIIQYYGKTWAEGSFTISGEKFNTYAKLHKTIAKGVVAARTLPQAKLTNKKLEKKMIVLLKDAGWGNVYRLNIVDKDWWIERVSGGNSPVKAKYIAAVVLTKGADDNYFYKHCTFHQDKLITGAFGPLYLSHQGEAVSILKSNIDK